MDEIKKELETIKNSADKCLDMALHILSKDNKLDDDTLWTINQQTTDLTTSMLLQLNTDSTELTIAVLSSVIKVIADTLSIYLEDLKDKKHSDEDIKYL